MLVCLCVRTCLCSCGCRCMTRVHVCEYRSSRGPALVGGAEDSLGGQSSPLLQLCLPGFSCLRSLLTQNTGVADMHLQGLWRFQQLCTLAQQVLSTLSHFPSPHKTHFIKTAPYGQFLNHVKNLKDAKLYIYYG